MEYKFKKELFVAPSYIIEELEVLQDEFPSIIEIMSYLVAENTAHGTMHTPCVSHRLRGGGITREGY